MAGTRHHRLARALLLPVAVALVAGCVSKDQSDLEARVSDILSRPGTGVEPLPPLKPPVRYLYSSADGGQRSPFESAFRASQKEVTADPVDDAEQRAFQTEVLTHTNKEELEQFAIDGLRMVGILENEEALWGIIRDPQGSVHRVKVGNYLGLNFGKILRIQEDRIEVREIVKDAQGRWEERQTELALSALEEE